MPGYYAQLCGALEHGVAGPQYGRVYGCTDCDTNNAFTYCRKHMCLCCYTLGETLYPVLLKINCQLIQPLEYVNSKGETVKWDEKQFNAARRSLIEIMIFIEDQYNFLCFNCKCPGEYHRRSIWQWIVETRNLWSYFGSDDELVGFDKFYKAPYTGL